MTAPESTPEPPILSPTPSEEQNQDDSEETGATSEPSPAESPTSLIIQNKILAIILAQEDLEESTPEPTLEPTSEPTPTSTPESTPEPPILSPTPSEEQNQDDSEETGATHPNQTTKLLLRLNPFLILPPLHLNFHSRRKLQSQRN